MWFVRHEPWRKKSFPVLIHCLLALLLAGSLSMAVFSKEFQFWFNLAITVLLGWIAVKK
jgi:positive regulator of sigma E activity